MRNEKSNQRRSGQMAIIYLIILIWAIIYSWAWLAGLMGYAFAVTSDRWVFPWRYRNPRPGGTRP